MPLWLDVILILLALGMLLNACRNSANTFKSENDRSDNRFVHWWWPPRMSNFLILFGVGLFIYDCLRHPPFGASRLSICGSVSVMALGFFYRNWEG